MVAWTTSQVSLHFPRASALPGREHLVIFSSITENSDSNIVHLFAFTHRICLISLLKNKWMSYELIYKEFSM